MKFAFLFIAVTFLFSGVRAQELPSGVHRLSAFDPMMAFDELMPLKEMIGNSEYVALGEAIHTAGSFVDGKFRVTRFLIEEMGFRSVGIEAPWSVTEPLNQYIKTCKGSITEAGTDLYRPWKDQGFADFIHWACKYNQKHLTDPIYFYGFDTQYQIGYAADAVKKYLSKTSPKIAESLTGGLKKCFNVEYTTVKTARRSPPVVKLLKGEKIPTADHNACINSVKNISIYLKQNKTSLIKKSSRESYSWAMVALTTVSSDQKHFYYITAEVQKDLNKFDYRDLGMADLAIQIKKIERPNTRTVLWAHNAHLAKAPKNITPASAGLAKYKMGQFLAKKLGKDYFPIAQIGYNVAVDDHDFSVDLPSKITVQPTSTDPRSLEFMMHNLGGVGVLADGQSDLFLPGLYKSQWMTDALEFVPREQFDAYIFHETSRMYKFWEDPK